jgi:heat shock protein HslJ
MRAHKRIGLVAAAALVSACSTLPAMDKLPSLDGTAWVLQDLTGRTLAAGSRPTLQFTDDRLSGSDGCNRFSGRYTVAKQAFKVVQPLATTQMACPGEIGEQARAYIEALTVAGSYRLAEGRLQLIAASGTPLATFVAQSTELANTSWRTASINNGRGAIVGVLEGAAVTVQFGDDGRASGWAGCNRWTSSYTAQGSSLKFGPPAATRKMCAEPGVMEQEQRFLEALATVSEARAEGDRLELRSADGAMVLVLYREGSD